MPIPDPAPQWGTIATVAALLDVSEKTVRRRIADGTIPAQRFGRLIRIPLATLGDNARPLQYIGGAR